MIPWNKGETKLTNLGVKKISETFKKNKIDNFLKWREKAKLVGLIPNSDNKFNRSKELAFLIGLVLGDGNVSEFPRTECLRLTLGTDKPELANYAVSVIAKLFNKPPSIIKRTNSNCYNITIYQKNISKRLGIPVGARGKMEILLPPWIWNKKLHMISVLKGLFEAEASYCVHERTYTYNFEFSNRNLFLLNEVERGLRVLGYAPERRKTSVRLRKKAEAIGFKDLINFRSYP